MITEERLRELIEQKAVIYAMKDNKYIYTIGLNQELDVVNWFGSGEYKLCVVEENGAVVCDIANIEQLFETREDAEWQSEFVNIPRTETLSFPTWEEFEKMEEFLFDDMYGSACVIHSRENKDGIYLESVRYIYKFDYSYNGYIEACRLAKKLFLEGSDETYND